jgi:nucleotide-binding universal stress UspA family protein
LLNSDFPEAFVIQNVKKILAPIDFSEISIEAMRAAMELAKGIGAEVHLAHIIAPHHHFIPLPLATNAEQSRELVREAAMLEQAEEELKRIKKDEFGDSKNVVTFAEVGHPVQKLLDYAKRNEIDLIMLATHGRTGAEHLVIGSVAEKLVRYAPCSVLVYRRRKPTTAA